jgi:hypothetical protein
MSDWNLSRGERLLDKIKRNHEPPKAESQSERRERIWRLIQSTGITLNRSGCYNTRDEDIKWIMKNKPVKLVRCGHGGTTRISYLVCK